MLESLNKEQRLAVEEHKTGPLLVLAGAGTGKTRVLTCKIAHILSNNEAFPSEVLAVTFTNKAANEMRERISSIIQSQDVGWVGTFHSVCVRILRKHIGAIDYKSDFSVIGYDEQLQLIKKIIKSNSGHLLENITPKNVLATISRWKDDGFFPHQVKSSSFKDDGIIKVYEEYQDRLKFLNSLDFGDLLLFTKKLFEESDTVLQFYQNKFKYIFVDEYQDINSMQMHLVSNLAKQHGNICCVGDDDQSIYGWRGANIDNILNFEKDFPGASIIRLKKNYRSTQSIVDIANTIISRNSSRFGKNLESVAKKDEKVTIFAAKHREAEKNFISDKINNLLTRGFNFSDVAILVRAGFQTREFEDAFIKKSIPYNVLGGIKFYERQEIRDAIAYTRLLMYPDDGISFERIVNTPKRGIGESTLKKIYDMAREYNFSLPKAAKIYSETGAISKAKAHLKDFFLTMSVIRDQLEKKSFKEVIEHLLKDTGYLQFWEEQNTPESDARLENLQEYIKAVSEFSSIIDFLEYVSLSSDKTIEDKNVVLFMTLHSAKGLEFPVVFLPCWEEGSFPHKRSSDNPKEIEEERRLAYVGITRAKKILFISYSMCNRTQQGFFETTYPSRFIGEIGKSVSVQFVKNSTFRDKNLDMVA